MVWKVHKFGGTSLDGASRFLTVVGIVGEVASPPVAVVVSAMARVTDALIEVLDLARRRDETYLSKFAAIKKRHLDTIAELFAGTGAEAEARKQLSAVIESDVEDIEDILRAVWLGKSLSEQTLELVSGYGELWSAQMMERALALGLGGKTAWLDARNVLIVQQGETGPRVDWNASQRNIKAFLAKTSVDRLVVTGYVASTPEGVPTTLKRNGSDHSASIFGSLLEADGVTIWTDVDGVLSADPRRVPEAQVLDELSYAEAMELAYFGAKVIHPNTMAPVVGKGIPIWIRNTLNPSAPGTKIHRGRGGARAGSTVKGFSTVDGVALLNVEGTGMIGVPGIAKRLFGALREVGVSVIMISQASSEHSICFAVPDRQGELARKTVTDEFAAEMHHGHIQTVDLIAGQSILAAVGDAMAETPGVAARFFGALGKASVNIRAIAQGSSERNISAVIDQADSTRALRAVHAGFYLSDQTLSVGIVGPGQIGATLLDQLHAQASYLRDEFHVDLRVRAIMGSKKLLLDEKEIPLARWRDALASSRDVPDLRRFTEHVRAEHIPHRVIIDCTASGEVAAQYPAWLERGIHVITPNKKANSGPIDLYRALRSLGRARSTHYLYEATVGAGLPVISTLRDLIQTGDRVTRIEGVLSGTLSYIFNTFSPGTPFSKAVADAAARGYTEPDPRDDLSGMDVARKLIILGREMGLDLDLADVKVESLVPEPLRGLKDPKEFLAALPAHDAEIEKRRAEAEAKGEVLRYAGVVERGGRASVSLKAFPADHAFARISGSDNIIAFHTERYAERPLIVQGPGAGPQVTAAGVFADLRRLTAYLGAPT